MCTWLHLRFECGAIKKRDDIRLECEHLKRGSCVGRWGHHYVKFLNIPFDCLGIAPYCATCPGGTPSKATRAWFRTAIDTLVAREVSCHDDATKWTSTYSGYSVTDIIPPEPGPAPFWLQPIPEHAEVIDFLDRYPDDHRSQRSETPEPERRLCFDELLPRVETPFPVVQAERLPSMRLYREDIERRFVHTEIFGLGLQDSGSNGDNDEEIYFGERWDFMEVDGVMTRRCQSADAGH
ncbi:18S rRNA (guanine-N(7))-methyltransferase RID2 [Physcia stellaris]|nr:18S rRNA (guanine-N(7))-methyltransferase RID2 [Physcia stellaris]